MIGKLRGFSNSKLQECLLGLLSYHLCFGVWEVYLVEAILTMLQINNEIISSKDFINFVNDSRLTNEIIKQIWIKILLRIFYQN